jgi:hypothetical protein
MDSRLVLKDEEIIQKRGKLMEIHVTIKKRWVTA